jgi:hypothetical protein
MYDMSHISDIRISNTRLERLRMKHLIIILLPLLLLGCNYEPHLCEYTGVSKIASIQVRQDGIGMLADRIATITLDNGYIIEEMYRRSNGYKIGLECNTWECPTHGQRMRKVTPSIAASISNTRQ